MAIHRHRVIVRFGKMHIVATNLCVWFRVITMETIHELHSYFEQLHHDNVSIPHSNRILSTVSDNITSDMDASDNSSMQLFPIISQQYGNFLSIFCKDTLQLALNCRLHDPILSVAFTPWQITGRR